MIIVRNNNSNYDTMLIESVDIDDLEISLRSQLEEQLSDLAFLEKEKEKIGNPESLGKVIEGVVWEQFCNQIGVDAGAEFVKSNNGLSLDLRDEAHIQTTQNFAQGKIATHNTSIDYQKRYDDWQSNFQRDPNMEYNSSMYKYDNQKGVWTKWDKRSDSYKQVLTKGARADFDKGRPTGSTTNNTNMDHTVSAAEIIRDAEANAHLSREEQVAFANSDKNLNMMDSSANQSKGDSSMKEWLNSERDGKKPADRFDINEKELRQKDRQARKEYKKVKEKGEQRSIEIGKESQRQELKRIGKESLKAVVMQLFASLIKEIIAKLVKWFREINRTLRTLIHSIKEAITSFVKNIKKHLMDTSDVLLTTIASAIYGPIIGVLKKAWMLLKQGWKSLKDAVKYIRDPENKNKPIGILMLECGKILVAGLSAVGAIFLGEVISKGLSTIPIFLIEIPLLGNLAELTGIFFGAVISGILGAIAINKIEKLVAKKLEQENIKQQIDKGNEILFTQKRLQLVTMAKTEETREKVSGSIRKRHSETADLLKDTLDTVFNKDRKNNLDDKINNIDNLLESF